MGTSFYDHFGDYLKLGIIKDNAMSGQKLANLLRYFSTASRDEMISLAQYVGRKKEGQNCIFYAIGESIAAIESSYVVLASFREHGLEVLYLLDPELDALVMGELTTFGDNSLQLATRESLATQGSKEHRKDSSKSKNASWR